MVYVRSTERKAWTDICPPIYLQQEAFRACNYLHRKEDEDRDRYGRQEHGERFPVGRLSGLRVPQERSGNVADESNGRRVGREVPQPIPCGGTAVQAMWEGGGARGGGCGGGGRRSVLAKRTIRPPWMLFIDVGVSGIDVVFVHALRIKQERFFCLRDNCCDRGAQNTFSATGSSLALEKTSGRTYVQGSSFRELGACPPWGDASPSEALR